MSGAAIPAATSDPLEPRRALVVPRGRRADSSARVPLQTLIAPLIEKKARGIVRITAPPGGGKTMALQHLLSVLMPGPQVCLMDGAPATSSPGDLFIVAAAGTDDRASLLQEFQLCPWTLDECMEYLCATHRDQCAAVLQRLKSDDAVEKFAGSPQLLTMVMDAMAKEPSPPPVREVCRCELLRIIPPGTIPEQPEDAPAVGLDLEQRRWWRHEVVRQIVRADWIVEELARGRLPGLLADMALPELVPEIAAAIPNRPDAIARLDRLILEEPTSASVPMAVSILIQAKPDWLPPSGRKLNLLNADLHNAKWAGVALREATLTGASLGGADLTDADLTNLNAMADFSGAVLRRARMAHVQLQKSTLRCADLSNIFAPFGDFSETDLEAADLTSANLTDARLDEANLENAICEKANFIRARLTATKLSQVDFRDACFDSASLREVDMSGAIWVGASFINATLHRCNLEGLDLPAANFRSADLTGSLLTGSCMPSANFRSADLRMTGLADIDWEHADLRDADFTRASFHMGSTRSGLVGSTIAGEGSRTGFYTDDFTEMNFKSPDEIRKANLRGANLLGAKVGGTDFYLVDLREAHYSPDQEEHFRRCGAILSDNA